MAKKKKEEKTVKLPTTVFKLDPIGELISKVEGGRELYNTSQLFRNSVHSLLSGTEPIKLIANLVRINQATQTELERINSTTSPVYGVIKLSEQVLKEILNDPEKMEKVREAIGKS